VRLCYITAFQSTKIQLDQERGKKFREMALASSVYRRQQLQRHPLTILTAAYIHGSQNKDRTASNIKTAQKKDELGPLPEQTRSQQKDSKRWLTYNHTSKPTPESVRERNQTVSSYYNQTAIDEASQTNSVKLAPSTLMYSSRSKDGSHVLKSAQYLRREMPIRISHRIAGIRSLPFIVGCNPTILAVHELYIRSFHMLNEFPEILTESDQENFSHLLRQLLDDHKDVVSQLASGFKECRKHMKDEDLVRRYLDKNLTSRLSMRMLATHHLNLAETKDDHIGIIKINMSLKQVVDRWAAFVQQITEDKYGHCPEIRISGHVNAKFPYIEMPLDYIMPELLKNAVRATIEAHPSSKGKTLPPVYVTLANNNMDFIIKISDRGGGIPHDRVDQVMQYNFSTAEESREIEMQDDIFSSLMSECNRTTSGPMHGYGFGLPTSRAYAEYLGGSLTLTSMQGLGTDVYLRLKHFSGIMNQAPFRI